MICPSPATAPTEAGHTSNVTTTNPLDLPYLPYLSFESELALERACRRGIRGPGRG